MHRGVYAAFTGPLDAGSRRWSAILACGEGAVLSHQTAAAIHRLGDDAELIHITVPGERTVGTPAGVVVHRSRAAIRKTHPVRLPPCTTVEDTVLDLVAEARCDDQVIALLTDACRQRRTTPKRLLAAGQLRPSLPRRELVRTVLAEVAAGAHSVLEVYYLRRVERAHGLPTGLRQRPVAGPAGREWVDVAYEEHGVLVELDGRRGHESADARVRDMRRENRRLLAGELTLRYGWADVVGRPCAVAAEVAQALRARGWPGTARRCGRSCTL